MIPRITVEFEIHEFVAYSYFAGTKTGKKYLFESGKLATSYAAQQLRLTSKMFLAPPVAAGRTVVSAGVRGLVTSTPTLAALVVGGIAFNAIGNTHAVQTAGHIGNPGVLGMGGTL